MHPHQRGFCFASNSTTFLTNKELEPDCVTVLVCPDHGTTIPQFFCDRIRLTKQCYVIWNIRNIVIIKNFAVLSLILSIQSNRHTKLQLS